MFDFLKKKTLVGRVDARYKYSDTFVRFHYNLFVRGSKRTTELVVTHNKRRMAEHAVLMCDTITDLCKRHHMYVSHVEPWLNGEDLEEWYVVKHRDLISAELRSELITLFQNYNIRNEPLYDRIKGATKL